MAEQTIPQAASTSNTRGGGTVLRDLDELEGTILVPNARPLNNDDSNNSNHDANTTMVATALPTTYFQYDDSNANTTTTSSSVSHADGGGSMNYQAVTPLMVEMDGELNNNNNNSSLLLPDAPVIPIYENANGARDHRQALKVGEQKGKIDNEQQREDIQRANQKVASIEYFARQQVKQANQLARSLNRKEEANQYVQTTAAMAERRAANNDDDDGEKKDLQAKKEPESFIEGTYGKDYEVNSYDTSAYDTSDYHVSEYKSVYE